MSAASRNFIRPTSLAILVLDLLGATALGAFLGAWPRGHELLGLGAVLVLYHHHEILRWRTMSLLFFGSFLASAVAWALLWLIAFWGAASPWLTQPLPILLAPWYGHLSALLFARLCRRTPVTLSGHGRARKLCVRAIRATPGCAFEVRPSADSTVFDLPAAAFGDRAVQVETPRGPLPLFPEGPEEGMGLAVRRTIDVLLGGILAVITAPLALLAALAVRLTSRGPVFYSQVRITRGETPFRIHKIRSMINDAEPDGEAVWPEEGDPRITWLGRIMRRLWIDELPQLFDVVRGSMSLVGPRPERPSFVKDFRELLPNYPLRHQVKTGVTGLSQVLGYTGNTSLKRRLHLDLRYVAAWTPLLDLKLLVATILRIVGRMVPDSRGIDGREG